MPSALSSATCVRRLNSGKLWIMESLNVGGSSERLDPVEGRSVLKERDVPGDRMGILMCGEV